MPITPPLDRIPAIPSKLVGIINKQLSVQLNTLTDSVSKTLQASIKIPKGAKCNDPEIQRIKNLLDSLSKQIQDLNKLIPVINQVNTVVKTAATVAQAIKAAQLLNPITGPAALAAELLLVQNMTILNAVQASSQLETIPNQLQSTLKGISVDIAQSLLNFSNVCNNESFQFAEVVGAELDKLRDSSGKWRLISGTGEGGTPAGSPPNLESPYTDSFGSTWIWIDNSGLESEFYQTKNVQQEDIDERNDLIQQLIETQTDLLTSLQEAPSQVYNQSGTPDPELGKPGDYYVDTENKIIYGPKVSRTEWPQGVNY